MSSRIASGFNALAPFYRLLSKLVFGNKPELAQKHFLSTIEDNAKVLILGGGSGALLKSLLTHKPNVTVDYIDISPKMIELARKRIPNPATVNFIIGTEANIPNKIYTVVMTGFYLDMFRTDTLNTIIPKIQSHVQANGQWLVTDFVCKKAWHTLMLWVMYRFFRIVTGIEARELPDWEYHLTQNGLTETEEKYFFGGFIKSCLYKTVIR